ncbi:hypothetical protein QUF74_09420 [Candidatus Halobeggiatoa sp. HSG11]|nr:hypothetical protein [Candidatus Halobeggiatoa sp. HSG11]
MASVMYDVLNCVALDSVLSHARAYEVDLAVEHVKHSVQHVLSLLTKQL